MLTVAMVGKYFIIIKHLRQIGISMIENANRIRGVQVSLGEYTPDEQGDHLLVDRSNLPSLDDLIFDVQGVYQAFLAAHPELHGTEKDLSQLGKTRLADVRAKIICDRLFVLSAAEVLVIYLALERADAGVQGEIKNVLVDQIEERIRDPHKAVLSS